MCCEPKHVRNCPEHPRLHCATVASRAQLWSGAAQIEVPLSSYLARVAERASWPQQGAVDETGTVDARLEALKAALTQIDAYGVQGAESVDEAQVALASRARLKRL